MNISIEEQIRMMRRRPWGGYRDASTLDAAPPVRLGGALRVPQRDVHPDIQKIEEIQRASRLFWARGRAK
jgi:hypothetical protein